MREGGYDMSLDLIDPYTAGKMTDYTRGEIARARGHRNWRTIFTSKSNR